VNSSSQKLGLVARYRARQAVRRTGFWFVDIPRTSSSAIRAQLGAHFGTAHGKSNIPETQFATKQIFNDHLTALEMRNFLGDRTWDNLFTFSVVRNPWDRLVSLYFYRKKLKNIPAQWEFTDFARHLIAARSGTVHPALRYIPPRLTMSEFLSDRHGNLLVDRVVKFEDRTNGLFKIGRNIGLASLGLSSINPASPKGVHYSSYYDAETRDLVARSYADDCRQFSYSFSLG